MLRHRKNAYCVTHWRWLGVKGAGCRPLQLHANMRCLYMCIYKHVYLYELFVVVLFSVAYQTVTNYSVVSVIADSM